MPRSWKGSSRRSSAARPSSERTEPAELAAERAERAEEAERAEGVGLRERDGVPRRGVADGGAG